VTALLLANGADVHQCDARSTTALEVAARSGHVRCAELLIAAGSDMAHFESLGDTCLHLAAYHKHTALVQMLLSHGGAALVNKPGCWCSCCGGGSVLMTCSDPATLKLLLAAGADVQYTTSLGNNCLHCMATLHQ
jgi:Ankyrin repeats (3 copies)